MRELRARVSADAAIDAFGIAEPIAEGVEVMDRHDAQREPAEFLVPIHPMRNAAHVDRGEDWFPDGAVFQQGPGRADRLVVTHVLVYSQDNTGPLAVRDGLDRFAVIHSQRLLRENRFDSLVPAGRLDQTELVHRRHRNVQHLNGRIVEQLLRPVIDSRDSMPLRDFLRAGARSRRDGDGIESGLPISDEVTVIDDESGAENADAKISPVRQRRVDVQFHGLRDQYCPRA